MAQTFPAYLEAAMKNAGLPTNADLANASGVDASLISRWRTDNNEPKIPKLRQVSKPLGVPLLDLLVAAGHLTPAEARMKDVPAAPPAQVTPMEAHMLAQLKGISPSVLTESIKALASILRIADPAYATSVAVEFNTAGIPVVITGGEYGHGRSEQTDRTRGKLTAQDSKSTKSDQARLADIDGLLAGADDNAARAAGADPADSADSA